MNSTFLLAETTADFERSAYPFAPLRPFWAVSLLYRMRDPAQHILYSQDEKEAGRLVFVALEIKERVTRDIDAAYD